MKHKKVIKEKPETERSQVMYKYAHLKRFSHDHQLQVYMYASMYVDPKKIPLEKNVTATKTFVVNYKKMSTPGPVPKQWLVFSHIRS